MDKWGPVNMVAENWRRKTPATGPLGSASASTIGIPNRSQRYLPRRITNCVFIGGSSRRTPAKSWLRSRTSTDVETAARGERDGGAGVNIEDNRANVLTRRPRSIVFFLLLLLLLSARLKNARALPFSLRVGARARFLGSIFSVTDGIVTRA